MITVNLEKQVFQTILDALEIASSWHKNEARFMRAHKFISDQIKVTS